MPAAQHRRYSRKSGETGRELLCSKAAPAAIQPAGSKKHPQSGQLRGSGSSATISLKNRIQNNYSMLWKEMQIKVFKNHRSSIGHSKAPVSAGAVKQSKGPHSGTERLPLKRKMPKRERPSSNRSLFFVLSSIFPPAHSCSFFAGSLQQQRRRQQR